MDARALKEAEEGQIGRIELSGGRGAKAARDDEGADSLGGKGFAKCANAAAAVPVTGAADSFIPIALMQPSSEVLACARRSSIRYRGVRK